MIINVLFEEPVEKVRLENDSIIIEITENENPKTILKKWMTEKTKNLIDETLEKHSNHIMKTPTRISVTDTKRWGYTRKNKSIIFNWQLSAIPPELAEFVIIHEFAHLTHLNHQKGFHRKIASIIPDYLRREKELQQYIAIEPDFEYRS